MDAAAPALLVGQAIGRIGNYFNQELFGGPTNLPWALQISPAHRPAGYEAFATFHPTFLYELIWNLALAGLPRLARPPPPDPAARPLRPLRRRLLGLPHLRGVAARRPRPPLPRPAAQLLRRLRADPRRRRLVRGEPTATGGGATRTPPPDDHAVCGRRRGPGPGRLRSGQRVPALDQEQGQRHRHRRRQRIHRKEEQIEPQSQHGHGQRPKQLPRTPKRPVCPL